MLPFIKDSAQGIHQQIISGPVGFWGRRVGWGLAIGGIADAYLYSPLPDRLLADIFALPIGMGVAVFFGSNKYAPDNGAITGTGVGVGLELLLSHDERVQAVGAGLLVLTTISELVNPAKKFLSSRISPH